jgi:rod shape-determining protein MreB
MNHYKNLFGFTKDIGIDLGTANTLVNLGGRGIIVREPSVVAIDSNDKKVLAVGNQADEMLGRTPENILAIRPLKDGVIADFEVTRAMIRNLIKRAVGNKMSFVKPRVIVCVPVGVTEVEKRAVEEAVILSGAKSVYLIEEPMAAAIGAGLPIEEPVGSMIVDIGGGTTEVAIISLCGIVISKSLRVAGDALNSAIASFVKREFGVSIGEKTAEEIKIALGSAIASDEENYYDVTGRDLSLGLPKNIRISSAQVREAMNECLYQIVMTIKETLEETPPELAADIMNYGIVLTGGGALIKNLDRLISQLTGIPVKVCENPLDCVAVGTGIALENERILSRSMFAKRR